MTSLCHMCLCAATHSPCFLKLLRWQVAGRHLTELKIQLQIGKREDKDREERREEMRREKERVEGSKRIHSYSVTTIRLQSCPALPSPALPFPVSYPLSLLHSSAICIDRGIHCNHNEYMPACHYDTVDCRLNSPVISIDT